LPLCVCMCIMNFVGLSIRIRGKILRRLLLSPDRVPVYLKDTKRYCIKSGKQALQVKSYRIIRISIFWIWDSVKLTSGCYLSYGWRWQFFSPKIFPWDPCRFFKTLSKALRSKLQAYWCVTCHAVSQSNAVQNAKRPHRHMEITTRIYRYLQFRGHLLFLIFPPRRSRP